MIHTSENLVDQDGLEILVCYDYEKSFEYVEIGEDVQTEPMVYTELTSVEVVIKGVGINILPVMNEKQKEFIISQLSYQAA